MAEAAKPLGAKEVEYHPLSLNDFAAVDKLAKSLVEKYGVIDVIVNNAGDTISSYMITCCTLCDSQCRECRPEIA